MIKVFYILGLIDCHYNDIKSYKILVQNYKIKYPNRLSMLHVYKKALLKTIYEYKTTLKNIYIVIRYRITKIFNSLNSNNAFISELIISSQENKIIWDYIIDSKKDILGIHHADFNKKIIKFNEINNLILVDGYPIKLSFINFHNLKRVIYGVSPTFF